MVNVGRMRIFLRSVVRHRVRRKLERLLIEVLGGYAVEAAAAADARAERLGAELGAARAALVGLEVRMRRDLHFAAEVEAAVSSSRFARDHMPTVPTFAHRDDTLRFAAELVTIEGMVLEFGVASGRTLRILTECLPGRGVAGIDTFTGLPEHWRSGFPIGAFSQQSPPVVCGAELVVGLFAETLPEFLAARPDPVALLHLNADLYSSTRTVLDLVGDRLVPGSIVLFDEYFNYPGWPDGEHRAWSEFVERTGRAFEYTGYTYNDEQVVVTIMA